MAWLSGHRYYHGPVAADLLTLLGLTPTFNSFIVMRSLTRRASRRPTRGWDLRLASPSCWHWTRKLQEHGLTRATMSPPSTPNCRRNRPLCGLRRRSLRSPNTAFTARLHAPRTATRSHPWRVSSCTFGVLASHLPAHPRYLGATPSSAILGNCTAFIGAEIARIEGRHPDAERLYRRVDPAGERERLPSKRRYRWRVCRAILCGRTLRGRSHKPTSGGATPGTAIRGGAPTAKRGNSTSPYPRPQAEPSPSPPTTIDPGPGRTPRDLHDRCEGFRAVSGEIASKLDRHAYADRVRARGSRSVGSRLFRTPGAQRAWRPEATTSGARHRFVHFR